MFSPGDYVKVKFENDAGVDSEWMWVHVESVDDSQRIVFGTLDSEPIVVTGLHLGMKLAVSFDNIREHMKGESFNQ
jgi:uncharacterized protein YegJ (DUF2314 family)